MGTAAILRWNDPDGHPVEVEVEDRPLVLGRNSDCDVVLAFPFVSGRHARLLPTTRGWRIEDLGSTNGVLVEGEEVEAAELDPGSTFYLGQLCVELSSVTPAPLSDSLAEATTMLESPTDQRSDIEKLAMLVDLQSRWEDEYSPSKMFDRILRCCLQISGAERACILTPAQGEYRFRAGLDSRMKSLTEEEFQASRSVVRRVTEDFQPVFMTQGLEEDLAEQASVMAMDLCAVACLPLSTDSGGRGRGPTRWGILYLDSRRPMHMLSGLDEKILRNLAIETAQLLEKLELLSEAEEKKRIQGELAIALEAQQGLLPREVPEVEGLQVQAWSRPCRYVSGDFYDVQRGADGSLIVVLADVSGKGVGAALLGASALGALQMLLRRSEDLAEIVSDLNRLLCDRSEDGSFLTLFMARIDVAGRARWVSAGHNPAYRYVAATGQIEELRTGDVVVGFLDEATFHSFETQLDPGDLLLVYSDGLNEAENSQGEMFGEDRIRDLLADRGSQGVRRTADALDRAHREFMSERGLIDDVSVVLVGRCLD